MTSTANGVTDKLKLLLSVMEENSVFNNLMFSAMHAESSQYILNGACVGARVFTQVVFNAVVVALIVFLAEHSINISRQC